MNCMIKCANCRRLVPRNPRLKDQGFCGMKPCQQARKTEWQRRKMASDPDYRMTQEASQRNWARYNQGYWWHYRDRNKTYCDRNRQLQKGRDARRRTRRLAKMDALKPVFHVNPGRYLLLPNDKNLAKMDALTVEISPISTR